MSLRRYSSLAPSKGTVIPHDMRLRVLQRDQRMTGGCVGFGRFPVECAGGLELDHVRASHGIGMKSETTDSNLVALCGACHRWKTEHGREARPILLAYLADVLHRAVLETEALDCNHVDPQHGCRACRAREALRGVRA